MKRENPLLISAAVLFCTTLLTARDVPAEQIAGSQTRVAGSAVNPLRTAPPIAKMPQLQTANGGGAGQSDPMARPNRSAPPRTPPSGDSRPGGGTVAITIQIMTDDRGEETTWELVERGGGLVDSGGPYESNTFIFTQIEVDASGCYDFTLHDAGGDGLCCEHGEGYYQVLFNSLPACSGGAFEQVVYCSLGYDCPALDGACCVDLTCVATNMQPECAALGGRWFAGESCDGPDPFVCPESYADFLIVAPHTGEVYSTCDDYNGCSMQPSRDHTYEVIIPYDATWCFSLCRAATWDTYLYLGTTLCGDELGENNDACGWQSEIAAELTAGAYFVAIEADGDSCGEYALDVFELVGACCDGDLNCIGTMGQDACYAIGHAWWEGEDCDAGFVCPVPPPGDDCEDPVVITPPYPVTVIGDNTPATIDCPGLLDWNAIWYEIELPYTANDVDIVLCPTTVEIYTGGIILMDDCACDDYIISSYEWITCDNELSGLHQWWEAIPGPGTILFPAYLVDSGYNGMEFEATFDVTEHVPCVVECPPCGIEYQAPCGSYTYGG